jgi:hypothetical protein
MKDFIQLQPHANQELDSYILKLETQIKGIHNAKVNKHAQQYFIDKKYESFNLMKPALQVGMTEKEAEMIKGKPKYIDQYVENNLQFKMWTYPNYADISHLYFRDKMLIRIEK